MERKPTRNVQLEQQKPFFSEVILASMREKSFSVTELAKKSGLHRSTVSKYVNHGAPPQIKIGPIILLANALEINHMQLFDSIEPNKHSKARLRIVK